MNVAFGRYGRKLRRGRVRKLRRKRSTRQLDGTRARARLRSRDFDRRARRAFDRLRVCEREWSCRAREQKLVSSQVVVVVLVDA